MEAGFPSLWLAAKATVHRILVEQPLHPEKVKYYLERCDPDFEVGMRRVLIVYQDVALQNAKWAVGQTVSNIITVSVDEKQAAQAIGNTSPDLPPVPGNHPTISRDHEYERLGICSILAALDLQDGHVTHAWKTATAVSNSLACKMARSLLRHIRVQSLDELKARILKGIAEINASPVVHRGKIS